MQTHLDVISFDDITTHNEDASNNFNDNHQIKQHQNDSEDDKNSDHHHHCVDLTISTIFVPANNNYSFAIIPQEKKAIFFHKTLHEKKYLKSLLQPPQV